jgi:cobalt-zinc-cadmium efflux system protein
VTPRRRLQIAIAVTAVAATLEFLGAYLSRSLARTSDAVHVCMDLFALTLALLAAIGAERPADLRRTYGYGRVEVLGALANGTLLLVATIGILYAAALRFAMPVAPHATTMSAFAALGLLCNICVGGVLRRGKLDLNVRTALFHVIGDALGAAAVIVGGALIALTGAAWIDPTLSLFIAGIIVVGVARVMRDATSVLLESFPRELDPKTLTTHLVRIGGVTGVHDLHVWSIGSGSHALSAHVLIDDRRLSEAADVLREIDGCLKEHFGIAHVTIQFECDRCPVVVDHR